jgi:putative glutamine amidotransferase
MRGDYIAMERKPLIGITVAHCTEELKSFPRAFYVESVKKTGGQPILLPPVTTPEEAQEVIALVDGLLLTGGGDIAPPFLGELPKRGIGECIPERDWSEVLLTQTALKEDIPILGICRGIQVLAIVAGGKIYQDLPSECPETIEHKQRSPRECAWHEVQLNESHLERLIGEKTIGVNSIHHQAVSVLPEGFIANAIAPDGIIEGIEKLGARFCLGVQWHPEAMNKEKHSQRIFAGFVKAAQKSMMDQT